MKKFRDQKGVAAVEFAIILPVLIFLIFGIIEFSLLLYDKQVITNASREGARAGIVWKEDRVSADEIIAIVNNYCSNYLITFGTNSPPTVTPEWTGEESGSELTVTVTYDYDFLFLPNFITGLTGGRTLSAVTVMRME
ncbi:MAG: pilus assembly protein [Candidatus Jettenia caeni]|nr:pilus assembly protein [Candidatus Jettenia caeni]